MSVTTPIRITILARVEGSEVLNEIGTVEVDTRWRAVSAADDNAAMEATGVVDIDVVQMLRDVADEIEAGRT
jgi:hypothetical protein